MNCHCDEEYLRGKAPIRVDYGKTSHDMEAANLRDDVDSGLQSHCALAPAFMPQRDLVEMLETPFDAQESRCLFSARSRDLFSRIRLPVVERPAPRRLDSRRVRRFFVEVEHRDEARSLAPGDRGAALRLWSWLVGAGSTAGVALARRL
jgi:hypothetical protein